MDDRGARGQALRGGARRLPLRSLALQRRGARPAGPLDGPADAPARTQQLRAAIVSTYLDPASGLLRAEQGSAPGAIGGPAGWFVWPGRVLDRADPRLQPILAAEMAQVLSALRGEGPGAGYLGKVIVAAALYGREGGARDQAREAIQRQADMATEGTLHFGEIFQTVTGPGGSKSFVQRVATPHVWEGALFYLGAMALTAPERFNADQALPPSSGCGCRGAGAGGVPSLLVLAALLLARRRRPGGRPCVRSSSTWSTVSVIERT